MSDRARLLHRRSELGYTDRLVTALPDEPEAVDVATQKQLTRQATLRQAGRRREVWTGERGRIEQSLQTLRQAFGAEVSAELRGIRREVDRLERKFAR